ncbi:MAG: hypothetical protein AAGB04_27970 [Pseudomonadota bacterium]
MTNIVVNTDYIVSIARGEYLVSDMACGICIVHLGPNPNTPAFAAST